MKKILVNTLSAFPLVCVACTTGNDKKAEKPNIVLIMVDDMGYSDIGCFGGEIPTPNLDKLSEKGVRFTHFYNTARSCPTRASLLTGLYQHQAGIGGMSEDPYDKTKRARSVHDHGVYGYRGFLNKNCVTMAEVLKDAGYHTYMVGKWHVGMDGQEKWPLQRGFDRYYGILAGASSYLKPHGDRNLTLDNKQLPAPEQPYYTTDAFTDYSIEFINEQKDDEPFFLYVAYNAPHWPLHAKEEDIRKFRGTYKEKGWQKIRQERFDRMVKMGLIDESWGLAEWEVRQWDELSDQEKDESDLRMSVYAAQVHAVDYNVGKIIDNLEKNGKLDNTMIVFLSDNGACAEPYDELGGGRIDQINDPNESWTPSYGLAWAMVSNTPYRKYKVRAYEGGTATPFIISWPKKLNKYNGELRHSMSFLPDIMATFVDVANAEYPAERNGISIHPMAGKSMYPAFANPEAKRHDYIFGEHFDNLVARKGDWKAVKDEKSKEWELYNIRTDRTERHNVAAENPEILDDLVYRWKEWAGSHYVYPKR